MTTPNDKITLADLLDSISGMSKQASDEDKEKADKEEVKADKEKLKADEDKEKSDKDDDKGGNPFAKKDDKDDDEEEDKGQEKSASELGAEYAQTIMEKVAAMNLSQNPQSAAAGETLADALMKRIAMTKQANAGDITTTDGVAPGSPASKAQRDNAQMVAEQDAEIKPMPLGDGDMIHGTVNEIFDAVMADAAAQGAVGAEQHPDTGIVAGSGAAVSAVPNQVKTAALRQLMDQGIDFEDAIQMTKQAAAEIEDEMEKMAAIDYLCEQGLDFDDAYALVKQAEEELIKEANAGDITTTDGVAPGSPASKAQRDNAQMVAEHDAEIKPMPLGNGDVINGTVDQIFDAMIADAAAQGAVGAEQHPDEGIAANTGDAIAAVPNQVKTAAVHTLMEAGFDYDSAIEMVKSASEQALQTKQAQLFNSLVEQGHDFDSAVELVKQAGAFGAPFKGMVGAAGGLAGATARLGGRAAKAGASKVAAGVSKATPGSVKAFGGMAAQAGKLGAATAAAGGRTAKAGAKALGSMAGAAGNTAAAVAKKHPVAVGAGVAGLAAAGGAAGYAVGHKKKAAVDMLMERGVDFDTAVETVNAKAQELYGE